MAIIHLDDSVEFVKEIGGVLSAEEVERWGFACTLALNVNPETSNNQREN